VAQAQIRHTGNVTELTRIARGKRREENREGLIRAILRDHSNGKTNL
jgi:hypothetical protein